MNYSNLSACAAFALTALAASSASAAITVQPGDLLAGFFKKAPDGTSVVGNTYVINLGPAANYREGITAPGVVANIGADLGSASGFGASWFTDPSVSWGIVGVVPNGNPTVGGDPGRTTYMTQAAPAGFASSTPYTLSSTNRGTASLRIDGVFDAMNGAAENGATAGGAFVPASAPGSFSSELPPSSTTFFGVGVNPLASLNGAASTLDLYRMLHATSGADLTSAHAPGDAVIGTAQYSGSFVLSSTGALTFVPEPGVALLGSLGLLFMAARRRK